MWLNRMTTILTNITRRARLAMLERAQLEFRVGHKYYTNNWRGNYELSCRVMAREKSKRDRFQSVKTIIMILTWVFFC